MKIVRENRPWDKIHLPALNTPELYLIDNNKPRAKCKQSTEIQNGFAHLDMAIATTVDMRSDVMWTSPCT